MSKPDIIKSIKTRSKYSIKLNTNHIADKHKAVISHLLESNLSHFVLTPQSVPLFTQDIWSNINHICANVNFNKYNLGNRVYSFFLCGNFLPYHEIAVHVLKKKTKKLIYLEFIPKSTFYSITSAPVFAHTMIHLPVVPLQGLTFLEQQVYQKEAEDHAKHDEIVMNAPMSWDVLNIIMQQQNRGLFPPATLTALAKMFPCDSLSSVQTIQYTYVQEDDTTVLDGLYITSSSVTPSLDYNHAQTYGEELMQVIADNGTELLFARCGDVYASYDDSGEHKGVYILFQTE